MHDERLHAQETLFARSDARLTEISEDPDGLRDLMQEFVRRYPPQQ